jgi:hypothetical protein
MTRQVTLQFLVADKSQLDGPKLKDVIEVLVERESCWDADIEQIDLLQWTE